MMLLYNKAKVFVAVPYRVGVFVYLSRDKNQANINYSCLFVVVGLITMYIIEQRNQLPVTRSFRRLPWTQ